MRLSINEVRLQMHLHLLNRPGLLPSRQRFSPNFCNLRLDANAATKVVRKGIMYDVRRRTSRVTTWAYRLAPAARTTEFQDEEERMKKKMKEKRTFFVHLILFLRATLRDQGRETRRIHARSRTHRVQSIACWNETRSWNKLGRFPQRRDEQASSSGTCWSVPQTGSRFTTRPTVVFILRAGFAIDP